MVKKCSVCDRSDQNLGFEAQESLIRVFKYHNYWLMIAFITWKSNLVPLLEGLCTSNPCSFEFSVFEFLPESNPRPRDWQSCAPTNWASFASSRIKQRWHHGHVLFVVSTFTWTCARTYNFSHLPRTIWRYSINVLQCVKWRVHHLLSTGRKVVRDFTTHWADLSRKECNQHFWADE